MPRGQKKKKIIIIFFLFRKFVKTFFLLQRKKTIQKSNSKFKKLIGVPPKRENWFMTWFAFFLLLASIIHLKNTFPTRRRLQQCFKGTVQQDFDLQFFSSFDPAWVTDQRVAIFLILVKISLIYSNFL